MTFTPMINYSGYEHVLNCLPCFVHPGNGNVYGVAIEKQAGVRQNLSVYRMRPNSNVREFVQRYVGGIDSAAQIAAGGCVIDQAGALHVWASAVPVGIPPITKTGFVGGFWPAVPGIDDPWSFSAGRPAVPIPPSGAIAALYTGVYVAADFDTPTETALRVQKQLDAIQELVGLLKLAGVVA